MNPNLNATPTDANADLFFDMAALEQRALDQNAANGTTIVPFSGVEGALFSFDRLRVFAGQGTATQNVADWVLDEIRVGDLFSDVAPIAAGGPASSAAAPEPSGIALAAIALAGMMCRRRR
jgi:hypothetical protein